MSGIATTPVCSSTLETGSALSFLTDVCGMLKRIKRTGWLMRQVPLAESDSDHMHRCAMCALVYAQPVDPRDDYSSPEAERFHPQKINTSKLLRMALTHDVCESLAGDITPFCAPGEVAGKHAKEAAAMTRIREVIGDPLGEELVELWREYEAQETAEALICKDIDKFEMVMQAFEYEREHLKHKPEGVDPAHDSVAGGEGHGKPQIPPVTDEPMRRFYITTAGVMRSPLFRRLDMELRDRREKMLAERGWAVTQAERQKLVL